MKSVQHKKLFFLVFPLSILISFFLVGHYAFAQGVIESWATSVVSGLLSIFVWALGLILVLVIQGLVFIASIQEFVQAQPVVLGWVIVRDICNMFFVVILMVIAFGTILHLENYNYKKWLPKLILMAVLINFSKTICGLLIDVAQVVMLTFVNAFKDVGGANLTDMLGITSIVQMDAGAGSFSTIVGAYVLGVIYLLVAIVVIITMMAMLAMRLVMIWIYVVLSPAAYLLAAFPGGQKYASQWWSEFIKNLIVGPVLAFFIWLSLASLSGPNPQTFNTNSVDNNAAADLQSKSNVIGSKAGSPSALIKFIIGIGMLIGGLKIASEIGGAAGSMAGKGMGALSKGKGLAMGAGIGALALAKKGIKTTGMAAINQKSVRNLLDSAGMQRSGFVGQALKFTGVRGLARKGSLALGSHKLEVEENAKKKVEAFKKVGATKTLASIASGKATTISQKAAKSEARKMVVVPEEHFEKRRGAVGLAAAADKREAEARIRDLDLTKNPPSSNQLMQLGKSGINLANVPKFKDFLEKNSVARGTYNSGQRDGGLHNYVIGKDKNGRELTGPGRFGVLTINRDEVNKATGRTGDTTYALRENDDNDEREEKIKRSVTEATTKSTVIQNTPEIMNQRKRISDLTGNSDKDLIERTRNKISDWNIKDGTDHFSDDNQVKEAFRQSKDDQIKYRQEGEEKKEEKKEEEKKVTSGSGSLSVNGFARGQGSVVGIDFEKLNPEIQNKMKANLKPGRNLQDIKGAQVSDQSEIKKIATSLIESIDNEIKTIKSKSKGSEITKSDSLRLNNLEIAKGKLKDPEKISNLELVNSSARGYTSASDVKETMIHEGIHGLGIDSESDTRYITNAAMTASSPQEREEIRTGGSRFMEHLENKMDLDSGNSSRRNRSVQAVIKDEDEDEDWDEYSLRADKPEKAVNETTKTANVTNVTNIINKNEKEKIKQDYNNSVKNNDNSFMAYYFKHLITSLNKLNSSLDKKSKAGDPLGFLKSSDGNQPVDKKDDNNLNNNLVA